MFFLLPRSVSVADASPKRVLPLDARCAHAAVGGGRSRPASCVVSSRSLWPLSPALGWMSCEGWGHLGGDLAGETATSQGQISRIHLGSHFRSHELLFPPDGRASVSHLGWTVWVGPFKKLSHLETFSPGSLDPTPGVLEASRELLVVSKVYGFISRFWEVFQFWEPYGPIHVEREAILGSPIKSTLKLSSQKILSALSSIRIILRKNSSLV